MPREVKKCLLDAAIALERIETFVAETPNESLYNENLLVQSAVERQLSIIGESLNQARKLQPHLPITDLDNIIRYRNFLVHAYDLVVAKYVWEVVEFKLPQLKLELQQLLEAE